MGLDDEEYIAESRDATPEPTTEIIEQTMEPPQIPQGILKKRLEAIGEEGENGGLKGEIIKEDRVPDMQLGRCRYVRLHDNVNYVAAALCLRGDGDLTEVLLIQEAKKSCHGKWYMPAGRVEAGETLEESVKREVKEETGYDCNVIELLSLQVQGSGWYRFAFFCEITVTIQVFSENTNIQFTRAMETYHKMIGPSDLTSRATLGRVSTWIEEGPNTFHFKFIEGELKLTPDQESLCARWVLVKDLKNKQLPLRGKDFIRLVDEAITYRKEQKPEIPRILPENVNIQGLFMEFMIVKHSRDGTRTEVLVHKTIADETFLVEHDQPFPTVEFGFEYFFAMVVSKCYRHLLEEGANVVFTPSHVVRLKCHPKPLESLAQGLALRVYCQHKQTGAKAIIRSPRYHWITVENEETIKRLHLQPKAFRPSLHML